MKKETRPDIKEAIEHGHPNWSHAIAYGPCTKKSRYSK